MPSLHAPKGGSGSGKVSSGVRSAAFQTETESEFRLVFEPDHYREEKGWRRRRDSNPRYLSVQRFSRPPP
jgi:hypothetical protein